MTQLHFEHKRVAYDDTETKKMLFDEGYHFVSERLTYELPVSPYFAEEATDKDKLAVIEIALSELRHSRFYADTRISFEEAQGEYRRRTADLFEKGTTYVVREQQQVAGYVILVGNEIVSIAVCSALQNRGIGSVLVRRAIDHCLAENYDTLMVVTQGSNIPSKSFYRKLGFCCVNREADYHLHRERN